MRKYLVNFFDGDFICYQYWMTQGNDNIYVPMKDSNGKPVKFESKKMAMKYIKNLEKRSETAHVARNEKQNAV